MTDERQTYPIQAASRRHPAKDASVNRHVYLAAYEVYSQCYGEQKAMLEGGCRGGFSTGELVAFLYARKFPKVEWRDRVDEALKDQDIK